MNEPTSPSLLIRLRQTSDEEAWGKLYSLYTPMIMAFCTKKGCTYDMSCDVVQETFMRLMRVMNNFEYDRNKGKFRSFLFKVVASRINDIYRKRKRMVNCGTDTQHAALMNKEDENQSHPLDGWDEQFEETLLVKALERVRIKVTETTFRSFCLSVIEDRPVDYVSEKLDILPNAIYQHRSRVMNLLKKEVETLKREYGELV